MLRAYSSDPLADVTEYVLRDALNLAMAIAIITVEIRHFVKQAKTKFGFLSLRFCSHEAFSGRDCAVHQMGMHEGGWKRL